MIEIALDISDLERNVKAIANGLQHPEPLMASLATTLFNEVEEQIAAGGRPPWAALKPSTIKRKIRAGRNNGILKFSGDLLARENREQSHSGNTAKVGFAKEYGVFPHLGTKNMVARPLVVADDALSNALADACADFIDMLQK